MKDKKLEKSAEKHAFFRYTVKESGVISGRVFEGDRCNPSRQE